MLLQSWQVLNKYNMETSGKESRILHVTVECDRLRLARSKSSYYEN